MVDDFYVFSLELVKVLPSLFHLFSLTAAVVVLVDDSLADVGTVADGCLRDILGEVVGDAPATDGVGAD